ncbi:MAG: hypothetical protein KDA78_04225 [Planctomycetaceae bacterium]|nr:hypothetical protein [Planctomycetaceae bacterium]
MSLKSRFVLAAVLFTLPTGCDQPQPEKAPVTAQNPPEAQTSEPEPEKRPNLVKRKTTEIVDKNKILTERPDLIEVQNSVTGSDPLTTSLTGYIAASSRVNVMNMQHQIDLMRASEDRNPTYQELMDMMRESRMELNALPDYQMYAYDDQSGKFLILEDPVAKKEFQDQAK